MFRQKLQRFVESFSFSRIWARYNLGMKIFLGFLWLSLLLASCFFSVIIAQRILRSAGVFSSTEKPSKAQEPAQKNPAPEEKTEPQPVYYIVEKKSRRKNTYSKPKRIRFE
jgi:hypothetical protein